MLTSNEIQEIIPHRYPFLLIDRITELNSGVSAKGIKNVTVNEPFFQGHFPEEHVMPGVLIVEALAQVGAVAMLSNEEHKGKIAYFMGIEKCKFKGKVIPGDTLELEVVMTKVKGSFGFGEAKAYVQGKVVVKAELSFALSNREEA